MLDKINDLNINIKNILLKINNKINKLKEIHTKFIDNENRKLFLFGLDSLFFQIKLINNDYNNNKNLFMIINNRIYCEYYKLYQIICEYLNENNILIDGKKITNKFSKYDDINTYKQYPVDELSRMYNDIRSILEKLNSIIEKNNKEIENYKKTNTNGLDINNFVSTHHYFNKILHEKIKLFNNYFEFFNNSHLKQLKILKKNLQNTYNQILNDIHFDILYDVQNKKKN